MKVIKNYYLDVVLVIVIIFYNYLTRQWDLFHLIGLIIIIVSLPLWLLAREQLGKYFTVRAKATGLVTTGLYSIFRNPIYLFSSITLFGAVLPSKNLIQYILFFIVLTIQFIRIKKEERVLEKKFGIKYLKYRKKTIL